MVVPAVQDPATVPGADWIGILEVTTVTPRADPRRGAAVRPLRGCRPTMGGPHRCAHPSRAPGPPEEVGPVTDTLPHVPSAPAGAGLDGRPRHLLIVSGPVVAAQLPGSPAAPDPPTGPDPAAPAAGAPGAVVDRPSIPPRVRTVTYVVLLLTSWAVLLVSGLAPIWLETTDMQRILATCGVVSSVLGAVAGGLGVAYRPTAGPQR